METWSVLKAPKKTQVTKAYLYNTGLDIFKAFGSKFGFGPCHAEFCRLTKEAVNVWDIIRGDGIKQFNKA